MPSWSPDRRPYRGPIGDRSTIGHVVSRWRQCEAQIEQLIAKKQLQQVSRRCGAPVPGLHPDHQLTL